MHARASIVHFYADSINEATNILRNDMLPSASTQQGYKGALILMSTSHPEKGIIITLWDTLPDLLSSTPPDDIVPQVERLGELIVDADQDIYHVLYAHL